MRQLMTTFYLHGMVKKCAADVSERKKTIKNNNSKIYA